METGGGMVCAATTGRGFVGHDGDGQIEVWGEGGRHGDREFVFALCELHEPVAEDPRALVGHQREGRLFAPVDANVCVVADLEGVLFGEDAEADRVVVARNRNIVSGRDRVFKTIATGDADEILAARVGHKRDASGAILLDGVDDPARLALANEEGVFTADLFDYRGEPVWAATRYVPETDWGLVVKFDANEKQATMEDFRGRLYTLALSLAGIGLLVAVFLGFRLSKPIHDLAAVANRIRDGDLDARAHRTREDEIGLLARTFNEMAAELQVRMTELHEFQKFFDVSLDLLCIAGTDGYFKRTNPAFTKTLGWTEEQLVSKPFLDLVHPDDIEATQNEIDKLARGVPTISFLNRFRRADGSWIYLRWNSYPDPDTGLLYAIARQIEDPQGA